MSEMISVASGFQYSVNIGYDLHNEDKLKNFIPTQSALRLLEEILASTSATSTERARILIGAYGKGKSHIVLTILSMLLRKDLPLPGLPGGLRERGVCLPDLQPQPATGRRHPSRNRPGRHPAGRLRRDHRRGPQAAGCRPSDVRHDSGGQRHPRSDLQPAPGKVPAGGGVPS